MVIITDEQVEARAKGFRAAGIDLDNLEKVVKVVQEIAETIVFVCMEFEKAMEQVAEIAQAALQTVAKGLEELEAAREKTALLELPTARDRKAAREKRRAMEQATAARFRQYRASESAWAAQKRTGQRKREWRGPWRGELTMKHKQPMPRYYGKNIAQHAERKFLRRKAEEANQEKRRERPADAVDGGKKD